MQEKEQPTEVQHNPTGTIKCLNCGLEYIRKGSQLVSNTRFEPKTKTNKKGKEIKTLKKIKSGEYICRDCLSRLVSA